MRSAWRILALLAWVVALAVPAGATPQKASAFYEDALKRFERDDFPGAIVQLKNAIQQDQRMLAAHLLLGKALLRTGDLMAAEAALEEALKQGINRGEVALPLAQIYLALGSPMQVIEKIQASGLQPSQRVEVLSVRGTAYAELGNFRMAAQSFDEARAADPRSPLPYYSEVPSLLAQGDLTRARAAAARAVELGPTEAGAWNAQASVLHLGLDMAGALKAYGRAIELQPRFGEALIARAAVLVDLRRDAEAEADLKVLRAAGIKDARASYLSALLAARRNDQPAVTAALGEVTRVIDGLPPAWLAGREQLLMVGALAHHASRNLEKAKEYLEMLVRRNGRNVSARKLLASIYVERKDFLKAMPLLEGLQRLQPDDPQVQFLLGSLYMGQRRYALATDLLEKAASRTGSPNMSRALGISQLGLGQIAPGIANLERVFNASPDDAAAGMALANVYMRTGERQKALQVAQRMVKHAPDNLTLVSFLGSIRAATGDRAGARSAYTSVLAQDPTYVSATLNLARLDVDEGKFAEGRRRLAELLGKRADHPDALYELGVLEQRAGRLDDAARHLRKAHEISRRDTRPGIALVDMFIGGLRGHDALEVAKDMASKYPDNLAVQVALARSYLAVADHGTARSVLQNATKMADFDAVVLVGIGRLQIVAGNFAGAAYCVQKALQGRPDDLGALALSVDIELRRPDLPRAEAALKALAAKHPNQPETVLASANLAMRKGQFAAAVAAYRGLWSQQETVENALNLARAHLAAGEPAKAATFLEGVAKARPGDSQIATALAEMRFRAGQTAQARDAYLQVLAARPEDAQAHNNFANLLLKIGDPAALQHAERAVKLAPNNPAYVDTLGWILVKSGQVDAGLRFLREARLRRPDDPEFRYHLAYALAKTGRIGEAKGELTAALTGPRRLDANEEVSKLKRELGM
ncbi:MAG: PEP-CTERM system TPR-repeat protein PrsT [Burkholderiales bacterium]|nr:PEP-CTERM system TPR-repeat protein PrsT [Burkholderiales bacterium]